MQCSLFAEIFIDLSGFGVVFLVWAWPSRCNPFAAAEDECWVDFVIAWVPSLFTGAAVACNTFDDDNMLVIYADVSVC